MNLTTKENAAMLALTIFAAPLLLAWRGYSFVLLWTWFVVPIFAAPFKDRAPGLILKGILLPAIRIAFAWPVTWFLP